MESETFPRTFIHEVAKMRAGEHLDVPGQLGVRFRMDADGRVFLLEPVNGKVRETFLFYKSSNTIYLGTDYVVSNVLLQ